MPYGIHTVDSDSDSDSDALGGKNTEIAAFCVSPNKKGLRDVL